MPDHVARHRLVVHAEGEFGPTTLLMGLTTAGGHLPPSWVSVMHAAIGHGLDVGSGLHELISDDPDLRAAATRHGVTLTDHRRPPVSGPVGCSRRFARVSTRSRRLREGASGPVAACLPTP